MPMDSGKQPERKRKKERDRKKEKEEVLGWRKDTRRKERYQIEESSHSFFCLENENMETSSNFPVSHFSNQEEEEKKEKHGEVLLLTQPKRDSPPEEKRDTTDKTNSPNSSSSSCSREPSCSPSPFPPEEPLPSSSSSSPPSTAASLSSSSSSSPSSASSSSVCRAVSPPSRCSSSARAAREEDEEEELLFFSSPSAYPSPDGSYTIDRKALRYASVSGVLKAGMHYLASSFFSRSPEEEEQEEEDQLKNEEDGVCVSLLSSSRLARSRLSERLKKTAARKEEEKDQILRRNFARSGVSEARDPRTSSSSSFGRAKEDDSCLSCVRSSNVSFFDVVKSVFDLSGAGLGDEAPPLSGSSSLASSSSSSWLENGPTTAADESSTKTMREEEEEDKPRQRDEERGDAFNGIVSLENLSRLDFGVYVRPTLSELLASCGRERKHQVRYLRSRCKEIGAELQRLHLSLEQLKKSEISLEKGKTERNASPIPSPPPPRAENANEKKKTKARKDALVKSTEEEGGRNSLLHTASSLSTHQLPPRESSSSSSSSSSLALLEARGGESRGKSRWSLSPSSAGPGRGEEEFCRSAPFHFHRVVGLSAEIAVLEKEKKSLESRLKVLEELAESLWLSEGLKRSRDDQMTLENWVSLFCSNEKDFSQRHAAETLFSLCDQEKKGKISFEDMFLNLPVKAYEVMFVTREISRKRRQSYRYFWI